MKPKVISILVFLLLSSNLTAQSTVMGYTIEGDSVVFTFNINDYKKYTDDSTGKRLDFDDFDIHKVVVSGEFNKWSRDQWVMKKVRKDTYQLKKKLTDFSDQFSWEFKFVINDKIWAEPFQKAHNLTPAVDDYGNVLNAYNLRVYTARARDDGNTVFRLKGFTDAKEVILTGSFNRWDERMFKMHKTDSGWGIVLQIKPGEYEYKFIVDGQWLEDPTNPTKRKNEFDGYNSVINVQVPVVFKLKGHQEAKNVILAGSFNHWDENGLKMTKTLEGWETTVLLSGGKHHYKFIVDRNWILDPENTVQEYDGHGNINSVKMVN